MALVFVPEVYLTSIQLGTLRNGSHTEYESNL